MKIREIFIRVKPDYMGNSKRCGMTFTDKNQPLSYCKAQGYPISRISMFLLRMTFGTLKLIQWRKLKSTHLYAILRLKICVAEWRRKLRFFNHVYLAQKVCEVCRHFNSSSHCLQGLDYWLTDNRSFLMIQSSKALIVRYLKFKVSVAEWRCGMTLWIWSKT